MRVNGPKYPTVISLKINLCDALHDLVHLYNFKNVKNTREGVILCLKLYHSSMCVFHIFLIVQMITNRAKRHNYFFIIHFGVATFKCSFQSRFSVGLLGFIIDFAYGFILAF